MSAQPDEEEFALRQVHMAYRAELGKMAMKVTVYATELERAGIPLPNPSDGDLLAMWRDAAAVIDAASVFVDRLGTSKELIGSGIANALQEKRALRVVE